MEELPGNADITISEQVSNLNDVVKTNFSKGFEMRYIKTLRLLSFFVVSPSTC